MISKVHLAKYIASQTSLDKLLNLFKLLTACRLRIYKLNTSMFYIIIFINFKFDLQISFINQ